MAEARKVVRKQEVVINQQSVERANLNLGDVRKQCIEFNGERAGKVVEGLSQSGQHLVQGTLHKQGVISTSSVDSLSGPPISSHLLVMEEGNVDPAMAPPEVTSEPMFGNVEVVIDEDEMYQVPGIGREEEVGISDQDAVLGPEDVDVMVHGLETEVTEESIRGWKCKASRYKSLVATLMVNVKDLKEANVKLLRLADRNEKKLVEYKAYSAAEVVEGIKPSLAPISQLMAKVKDLATDLKEMEGRMEEKFKDTKSEIMEISTEVCTGVETGQQNMRNLVQHLSSKGLAYEGSSYNIPGAMAEILEQVKELADLKTPVLDDVTGSFGGDTQEVGVGRQQPIIVRREENGALSVPQLGENMRETLAQEPLVVSGSQVGRRPGNSVITQAYRPVLGSNEGVGMLPTPPQFRVIEQNYVVTREMTGQEQGQVGGNGSSDYLTPNMNSNMRGVRMSGPIMGGYGVRNPVATWNQRQTISRPAFKASVPRQLFPVNQDFSRPPPTVQTQPKAKRSRWDTTGPV